MAPLGPPPTWLFLFAPVVWLAVLGLLSSVSGWRSLAASHRADAPPPEGRQWLVSGSLGWVDFSSSLIVGHSDAGLHLAIFPLFRPFHPPLLIPWTAITARRRGRYWLSACDTLEIDRDPPVRLRLRVGTTQPFESRLPRLEEK